VFARGNGMRASRAGSVGGAAGRVAGSLEELGGMGDGENVVEFALDGAELEVRGAGGAGSIAACSFACTRQGILGGRQGGVDRTARRLCMTLSQVRVADGSHQLVTAGRARQLAAARQDGALGGVAAVGAPLFASWGFYLHDAQATGLAPAPRPDWGAVVQYVVAAGPTLDEYLATRCMEVCVCVGGD
jgi:hypothetical protein